MTMQPGWADVPFATSGLRTSLSGFQTHAAVRHRISKQKALVLQGKQVTRASIEWYGPDR